MPRLNTEFFIARRISGRTGNDRRNIMVTIATITVAISVAVIIVTLAVIIGFKQGITDKLTGFGGDVQIVNRDTNTSYETTPITMNARLVEAVSLIPGFVSVNPYAIKGGIVKTNEAMQGIMLKGVDPGFDWTFFSDNLIEGELPVVTDSVRNRDVLISKKLASTLKVGVGDQVTMLFMRSDRPRPDRFKIAGIYDSGLEELDATVVPTDIRNVRKLNGWDENEITGYEIKTDDFSKLEDFADMVYEAVLRTPSENGEMLMVLDVTERYPNIFDWLKAHNVNAAVIIIIMLLVSFLNMVSALLIILLERTRMIGELKAMGMQNTSLQKLFVIRSGFIILKGMIWGNIFGIGLCLVQKYTGLLKLDESGYFLSQVPVSLGWGWITILNIAVFSILLLLLMIPTNIISRITPDSTIRYQ